MLLKILKYFRTEHSNLGQGHGTSILDMSYLLLWIYYMTSYNQMTLYL